MTRALSGGPRPASICFRLPMRPPVRWRAAMVLGRIGDSSMLSRLEELLAAEESAQTKKYIDGAITAIRKRSPKVGPQP